MDFFSHKIIIMSGINSDSGVERKEKKEISGRRFVKQ